MKPGIKRATTTITPGKGAEIKQVEAAGAPKPKRRHAARVALEERIGLPGTYSSISIHVEVEYAVTSRDQIPKALDAAYQEAKAFIDEHVEEKINQLRAHLQNHT